MDLSTWPRCWGGTAATGPRGQVCAIPGPFGVNAILAGVGVQGVGAAAEEDSPNSCRVPLFSLFLFEKFLLFKPGTPNKHLACHTGQLSNQTGDWLGQGPSLPNSFHQHPQSHWVHTTPVCLPLYPYSRPVTSSTKIPPGDAQTLFGMEGSHWPCGHWAWACSGPGPRAGPRDLVVLKHSPYRLIFQWPLQFWSPIFIYAGIP